MTLFKLTHWPSWALFILAGCAAATFAFVTVNLFSQAMASLRFLGEHGWLAVRHGVLWQVGELFIWGALALGCWLIFKICEQLMSARYVAWSKSPSPPRDRFEAQEDDR